MEYRTLGASGCVVSTFALGTMTFGAETDEKGAHEQLDRFLEAGGSLIDTADVYSAGVSEEIVGSWLAAQSDAVRDRVVLATKGRFPMGDAPNSAGLSRRHLARALRARRPAWVAPPATVDARPSETQEVVWSTGPSAPAAVWCRPWRWAR